MKFTSHRILNIGFNLALASVMTVGAFSALSLRSIIDRSSWVDHTNIVLDQAENILVLIQAIETGQRGYLITGQEKFLKPYIEAESKVLNAYEKLADLVKDNPAQLKSVHTLKPLIEAKADLSEKTIEYKAQGHQDEAVAIVAKGEGNRLMEEIREVVMTIRAGEHELLAQRNASRERSTLWTMFFIVLGVVISALILWLSKYALVKDLEARMSAEKALQVSEKRFQIVARATQDAVWDWDLAADTIWWNGGLNAIFGYEQQDAGNDSDWWVNGIHPDDRTHVVQDIHRLLDHTSLNHWSSEYRFRKKDGSYATVIDRGFILRDAESKAIRMIGSMMDISERKALELNLMEAREEAVEGSRLKSEFLANMSHEIRTPMNGVIGMTGLLLDSELNPTQREFAETIRGCADGLLTIINDILDFSKIEAGKLDIETLEFDLRSSVESCTDLLAQTAHAKGLELAASIDADTPRFLKGDAGRIRQVIMNLLGNAVKFTKSGEVILAVSCDSRSEHEARLKFEVRDTGIGISPENCVKIFEAFSQADGSTVRQYGGTGLGLTISRQLVTLMKGQIGVESQLGKGSIFWFTLPLEIVEAPDDQSTSDLPDLKGVKVLVLDDNATNQRIVHHQVVSWGMRNGSPRTPQEALDLLKREASKGDPYDLAILDMLMPEMNGVDLARLIKADEQIESTKLILMTSAGTIGRTEEMNAQGFAACMSKPVKQSQLLECLQLVMAKRAKAKITGTHPTGGRVSGSPLSIRILIAEDNVVNQKVALSQLQKLGYRADAVANGYEAFEAVQNRPYDLVLMDCQMPEMDGYEATRRIRGLSGPEKSIIVIAMTANAMEGDREKCLNAGMNDHISKPVKIDALAKALTQWTASLQKTA